MQELNLGYKSLAMVPRTPPEHFSKLVSTISSLPNLCTLSLGQMPLGSAVTQLASAPGLTTRLSGLNLINCEVGDEDLLPLLSALTTLQSLKVYASVHAGRMLHTGGSNLLNKEVTDAVVPAIASGSLPGLTSLVLDGTRISQGGAQQLSALQQAGVLQKVMVKPREADHFADPQMARLHALFGAMFGLTPAPGV